MTSFELIRLVIIPQIPHVRTTTQSYGIGIFLNSDSNLSCTYVKGFNSTYFMGNIIFKFIFLQPRLGLKTVVNKEILPLLCEEFRTLRVEAV